MSDRNQNSAPFTVDQLLGVWESFRGDGIHGLHYVVIEYGRDADGVWEQVWAPPERHSQRVLKSFGPFRVQSMTPCADNSLVVTVKIDHPASEYRITPADDGTLFMKSLHTTAGGNHYRRATLSVGRDGKSAVVVRSS